MAKTLYTIFLLFSIIACSRDRQNFNTENKIIPNDTDEVFRLLFDSAFNGHYLPDKDFLINNNPFSDSIIFQFDSLFIKRIPFNDSLKIKILTENQICELATQISNPREGNSFPNFLKLLSFQKTDSIFEVELQNTCVHPNFDIYGKPYLKYFTLKSKCTFGFLCGGGIYVLILKTNSSMKVKTISMWYD